jgi:outer membrane beta-barrel protein
MRAHSTSSTRALLLSALFALSSAGQSHAQDDDEEIPDMPAKAGSSDDESDDEESADDESDDESADDESDDEESTDDATGDEESDGEASRDDASADGNASGDDKADGDGEQKPAGEAPPAVDAEDVETIYVVQGKPRLVASTFEITPQFIQSVNDRFTSHTGLAMSALYHFKENFALELSAGAFGWWDDPELIMSTLRPEDGPRLGGYDTDTTSELNDRERLQPELVKLYRLTWFTTADAQWSPIYGKFSLHDAILGTFSVYLSVGAGVAGVQNVYDPDMPGPFDLITDNLGMNRAGPFQLTTTVGGGFRFYFFDWLGVRFEVRDYVQPLALLQAQAPRDADTSTFEVRNTIMVQAGVSFILPAPWQDN